MELMNTTQEHLGTLIGLILTGRVAASHSDIHLLTADIALGQTLAKVQPWVLVFLFL